MATPQTPKISVLIPAFNEEVLIASVIESVHASFREAEWKAYEVVVCDNNSTDQTAEVARKAGATVVFEPHNQIARARNAAAGRAGGEWFIFIDGDTFLNPALLRATINALSGGQICAGGTLVNFDRASLGFGVAVLTSVWNTLSSNLGLAAGSYIFCHATAWRETGGFDETLYAGEELFFSRKLKRWARERKLRFKVLTESPIVTSARKFEWYGQWELLRHFLWFVVRPLAIKRREACGLWYARPVHSKPDN